MASGTFVACIFSASQSMALPVRTARLPSRQTSVRGPECSAKPDPASPLPLHASIHSRYTPGDRAYFSGGGLAITSSCSDVGNSRGSVAYMFAAMRPASPTKSWPLLPPGSSSPGASCGGRGGARAPSRHTKRTGGRAPRAGKS